MLPAQKIKMINKTHRLPLDLSVIVIIHIGSERHRNMNNDNNTQIQRKVVSFINLVTHGIFHIPHTDI